MKHKKTCWMLIAALALLGAQSPWAADVVSSNIVGYEKITLNNEFTMVGVQFTEVGGDSLDLATVGALNAEASGFTEDGDFITEMRVWDGQGYDYYGWSGSSGTDVLDKPELDNKWLTGDLEEVTGTALKGSGFWLKTSNGEKPTITLSGQVPEEASVSVPLMADFNIVANPYPTAVNISDFGKLDSSYAGFTEDGDFLSELRVWDGQGYDYYGWSGSSGTDVLGKPELDNKWLNGDLEEVTTPLPVGSAVWIRAEKAGSITFTSPVPAN